MPPELTLRLLAMGNACCGGEDDVKPGMGPGHKLGGGPPAPMSMNDGDAREKIRLAAEQRHRENETRGTHRKVCVTEFHFLHNIF